MFSDLHLNIPGGLDVPLPKMTAVKQEFEHLGLEDVDQAVKDQVRSIQSEAGIQTGDQIAIGVGSRGIANLARIVKSLVEELQNMGAEPFIFPAMGSHGGATASGQAQLLARYGITESNIGAPVRATMETVLVTYLQDGTPLHCDKYAYESNGIILVNRIKPHTTVRGAIQSGLIKMMIIGMGKIGDATVMHSDHGMDRFDTVLPRAANALMPHIPFKFGLALLEDAHDETAKIEAVLPDQLLEREAQLLEKATQMMGRLYFDHIDVLVIDQIGKEISGAGFDPNVAGRNSRGVTGFDRPHVEKLVLLDLTDTTHGNATGIGMADVITQRLFDRIDFAATYANVITSAYLDGAAIPMVMATTKDAVSVAVKTVLRIKPHDVRMVRIKDTLSIEQIYVSESLLPEVDAHPSMKRLSEPKHMAWTEDEIVWGYGSVGVSPS